MLFYCYFCTSSLWSKLLFLFKNTTIQMPVANWKRATSGRATAARTTLVPPLQLFYQSKIWSNRFEKSQERICISFFPPEGDPAIHRPLHRTTYHVASRSYLVPTWQELGKKPAGLWPRREPQESSTTLGPSQPLTWSNEMTWTSSNNMAECSERKLGFQSSSGLTLWSKSKGVPQGMCTLYTIE